MTPAEAAEILRKHSAWRRGQGPSSIGDAPDYQRQIGEAIDVAAERLAPVGMADEAKTIAGRINQRRRHLRLSVQQVADRCGVTKQAAHRWCNNETDPRAQYVAALCRALRCSADWLLGIESTNAGTAGENP